MPTQLTCPECRAEVGGSTGVSPYKHMLNCFHLPNVGPQRILDDYQRATDERGRRIYAMVSQIVKGGA